MSAVALVVGEPIAAAPGWVFVEVVILVLSGAGREE
jgi:hypothetical protein